MGNVLELRAGGGGVSLPIHHQTPIEVGDSFVYTCSFFGDRAIFLHHRIYGFWNAEAVYIALITSPDTLC